MGTRRTVGEGQQETATVAAQGYGAALVTAEAPISRVWCLTVVGAY